MILAMLDGTSLPLYLVFRGDEHVEEVGARLTRRELVAVAVGGWFVYMDGFLRILLGVCRLKTVLPEAGVADAGVGRLETGDALLPNKLDTCTPGGFSIPHPELLFVLFVSLC